MLRAWSVVWFLILMLPWIDLSAAEQTISMKASDQSYKPSAVDVSFFRDPSQQLEIGSILSQDVQAQFVSIPTKTPNFNFTSDVIWLRLRVLSLDTELVKRYLSVSYAVLDRIEFFAVDAKGQVNEQFVTGDTLAVKSRPVADAGFVFPFSQKPGELSTLYLKVQSRGSVNIPLSLWNQEPYYEARQSRFSLQSIYFGAVFVMFAYNLILFLSTKQITYFYYISYILMYLIFITTMNGYFPLSLDGIFPDLPHIDKILDHTLLLSITANNLFSLLFTFHFLHLNKNHQPYSYWLIKSMIAVSLVLTIFGHFLPFAPTIAFLVVFSSLNCLIMLGVGISCLSKGLREARYYVVAWLFYNIGGILYGLVLSGTLPANDLTSNAQQVGQLFETILLSFALADRLNTLQQQNLAAINQNNEQQIALRMETETRLELASEIAHRINNPLHAMGLELSDANHNLSDLRNDIDVLLGDPQEDDEERALVRNTIGLKLEGISQPLSRLEYSLENASHSVQEIRSLSGIDGYALESVVLTIVCEKVREDIRRNFGEHVLQKISFNTQQIHGKTVPGNYWIVKNVIEFLVKKTVKGAKDRVDFQMFSSDAEHFTMKISPVPEMEDDDFARIRQKLHYLVKPSGAHTELKKLGMNAWEFVYLHSGQNANENSSSNGR